MKTLAIAALLAFTGCLVVPRFETTTKQTAREVGPPVVTSTGGVVVETATAGRDVVVRAVRPRLCTQQTVARFADVRHGRGQLVGGEPGSDPRAWLALVVIEPAVLLVSGIVTAIIVGGSDKTTHREVKTSARFPCPLEARDVAIDVTLPSGAVLAGTTADDGRVSFAIPDDEPAIGDVVVRAGPRTITHHYDRTRDACIADRAARFARAMTASPSGRVSALAELPSCGDARARAWSVARDVARAAVVGRCDVVATSARALAAVDGELYRTTLELDPDVPRCLAPH